MSIPKPHHCQYSYYIGIIMENVGPPNDDAWFAYLTSQKSDLVKFFEDEYISHHVNFLLGGHDYHSSKELLYCTVIAFDGGREQVFDLKKDGYLSLNFMRHGPEGKDQTVVFSERGKPLDSETKLPILEGRLEELWENRPMVSIDWRFLPPLLGPLITKSIIPSNVFLEDDHSTMLKYGFNGSHC